MLNHLNPPTISIASNHITQMTLCSFSSRFLCKVALYVAGTVLCSVVWRRTALQYAQP